MFTNETKISDRRCRRTRSALKSALLTLMKNKPLQKITVSELADFADVNRKTFYNHFHDVDSVLHELENDFLEQLFSVIDPSNLWSDIENPSPLLRKLISEMTSNMDFLKLLIASREHHHLLEGFRARLRQLWGDVLKDDDKVDHDILFSFLDFMSAGTVSVLESWITSESCMPLDKLTDMLCDILSGASRQVLHSVTKES